MAAPESFVGKEVRLQGTVGKATDPPRPKAYMLQGRERGDHGQ